ncbi:MAG: hypothetical protein JWO52_755 [Gammaproteobacteria bacterium]|nr:hypothetical protein [Gammaproteobacteria bacterium]
MFRQMIGAVVLTLIATDVGAASCAAPVLGLSSWRVATVRK